MVVGDVIEIRDRLATEALYLRLCAVELNLPNNHCVCPISVEVGQEDVVGVSERYNSSRLANNKLINHF
jgi:hypothetical protein